jgi:hypothetical protein
MRSSGFAGMATVIVFGVLSVASSKPKADTSATKPSSANGAATDPTKTAKLIGSCDRVKNHDNCSESYEPSTGSDEKGSCEFLDGKWRPGVACPRLKAITQCLEGNAPHLSASYEYEGSTRVPDASLCARGLRDFRKSPQELKAKAPASCHSIPSSGTCSQLSSLDEKAESSCLAGGGQLKQPPEPCPTSDVVATMKLKSPDGSTETASFYSTPWKGKDGTPSTWKKGEIMALCAIAGSACEILPEGGAAPAKPAVTVASKGGSSPKAKSSAKKKK